MKYGCSLFAAKQLLQTKESEEATSSESEPSMEPQGYAFGVARTWEQDLLDAGSLGDTITYYDSFSGRPLFVAPRGRTHAQ